MEFLNTLYESEYFVYIVGGTIGILLILFFVILLSGKKKNKETDQKQVEIMNDVTEKSVIADTIPVQEPSLDVTKEFKPEDLAALQTKMAEPVSVATPVAPVNMEYQEEDFEVENLEPVKMAEPISYSAPMPEIVLDNVEVPVTNQFNINEPIEEVKVVNPETLIQTIPEENVMFKVVEENELPKLNNENKEL